MYTRWKIWLGWKWPKIPKNIGTVMLKFWEWRLVYNLLMSRAATPKPHQTHAAASMYGFDHTY